MKTTENAERAHSRGRVKLLGWTGYADIVAQLMAEPHTARRLSESMGIQIQTMRRIMGRLHDLRHVHIVGWEAVNRGAAVPVFAWGLGVDVPRAGRPPGLKRGPLKRETALPELVQVCQFIAMLSQPDPVSVTTIAEESGSSWGNVARFIRHCKALGIVHIDGWSERPKGGNPGALYAFGRGEDVRRPKPVPRAVIEKRSREARRARAQMLTMIAATAANASRIEVAA